jgi:hypothetical protein
VSQVEFVGDSDDLFPDLVDSLRGASFSGAYAFAQPLGDPGDLSAKLFQGLGVKVVGSTQPALNGRCDAGHFAANVLENPEADQVAARIPFTGTIKDPETSLFATISSVLRNAFVSAFARSLEGSITLRDVKKNLQGVDPTPPDDEGKDKNKDKKKTGKAEQAGETPQPKGPAGKIPGQ